MRLVSIISLVVSLALVSGCGEDKKPKPSGGKAKQMMNQGTNQGSEQNGEVCGPDLEGAAFCADDYSIVLCSDGDWWLIDCGEFGMYCADDGEYVDCYEDEEDWDDEEW